MNLFLFVISAIGMTHIVVDGAILQWFRDFVKWTSVKIDAFFKRKLNLGSVVDCYSCCGFWTGLLMGYIWISSDPLKIFACGCASSFLANFAATILNWIEAATIVNLPKE